MPVNHLTCPGVRIPCQFSDFWSFTVGITSTPATDLLMDAASAHLQSGSHKWGYLPTPVGI
ncbi:hypothetical protein XACG115_2550009 [Xanthomonas citri pv. citri]|nr:hypothetical protein XACG115_2550009 [Xanthomonas citri pv. citri]